ncbi:sirohydrochlorin chelatase [Pseudorhodoferax sp. Leaf267]|uniref:sirohydrochlorin chelatase n=1 Tax=Pseudorhodoferax sp. Leaf267 TaxID=1736316 RepID=UPI0006FE3047|nr:CbiX/SirB N-terminal domain-containing protein [Pseudorhodoferax sp. Leaf267]KQP15064.1 cobalamin biosynthesis protein CbiX [Pseudorhodoferax sp. Leaf267]
MHAIVLFGHGSRDPLWRLPIEAVAARIAATAPHIPVRCAYLELCTPDLAAAVAELARAGATSIQVLPMFLGVGRHAREDLPELVRDLRERHPDLRLDVMPAVGENPRLVALMAEIALQPL